MVTNSLSERRGAGPGRSKIRWIIGDPFIASSTMVKMVVRTVAFSSICSALLVCVVYTLKHTTVLFPCQQLAQCVNDCRQQGGRAKQIEKGRGLVGDDSIAGKGGQHHLDQDTREQGCSHRCAGVPVDPTDRSCTWEALIAGHGPGQPRHGNEDPQA